MDHSEVVQIVHLVHAGWPNFRPADIKATIAFWEEVLKDYSFEDVTLAVKTFASSNSNGFAPVPGQLIDVMQQIKRAGDPEVQTENEAWAAVRKAIENSAYNYQQEFDKLPEITRRAIGSASMLQTWATDENFTDSVVQSQFLRCYRTELERAMQQDRYPEYVKRLIEQAKEKQRQFELTEAREALRLAGVNFEDVEVEDSTPPLPMIHEDEDGYEHINLTEYRKWREQNAREITATDREVSDIIKRFKGALNE